MSIEPLMNAYLADHETYKSGDVIIEEGSKGDWVYIVLEGQVKVTKRTSVGMLTIDVLKKAYRILWRDHKRLDMGILQVKQELEMIPELEILLDFLAGSKRGVIR